MKLFCYVDESGQDTQGQIFIVSVVIVETMRDEVRALCEVIERGTHKQRLKWYDSSHKARMAYIQRVLDLLPATVELCFASYQHSLDYLPMTVETVASAVRVAMDQRPQTMTTYKITTLIDGLPKSQERVVGTLLRQQGIRIDKVRGVKKDETDALIRLADAVCGFVRLALTGRAEAQAIFNDAMANGRLKDVTGE